MSNKAPTEVATSTEAAIIDLGDSIVATADNLGDAIKSIASSPNVSDSNMEAANLVDVIDDASRALWYMGKALGRIAPESHDPLDRGVFGELGKSIERAGSDIAVSIDLLAKAIREKGASPC